MGIRKGYYLTRYYSPNEKNEYGFAIYAKSRKHALELALARNIGEEIISRPWRTRYWKLPSELLRARNLEPLRLIHGVAFLAWLAVRSGKAAPDEILADDGLVHETVHYLLTCQRDEPPHPSAITRKELLNRILALEASVPGFKP